MTIRFEALTKDTLVLFNELLGSADFGGCFCAVWTSFGSDWEARCADPARPNFEVTARDVASGRHVGYFVYDKDQLVGWTGAGQKTSFPLLKEKLGSRKSDFNDDIWAIGCIALPVQFRGQGFADKIVEGVVQMAEQRGATAIEAYPVRPFHEPRSYRGTEGLYLRNGFSVAATDPDEGFEILLMRKKLRA